MYSFLDYYMSDYYITFVGIRTCLVVVSNYIFYFKFLFSWSVAFFLNDQ